MNTASTLFFICYIPEFYANYINKNANFYNVFEKIIILTATTFALSYSIQTHNQALIINYGPIFVLDFIALHMRCYYAYKNRSRDVRVIESDFVHDIENPIHDMIL
jgi:hypothetical protein